MSPDKREVLIIGGGVIGLSSAYYLSRAGHSVRVLESDTSLRTSCSEGNAGMIVPSHFIPLAAPGVISQGLKWMLNPKSPFFLRPRLDFDLARWIWLFARHSNSQHVANSESLLRDLSLESRRLHVELSKSEDFPLIQKGLLMLCQSDGGLEDEAEVAAHAHRLGLEAEVCDPSRIRELEPQADVSAQGGVWWPQDCHLSPQDFLTALRKSIISSGGEFIESRAASFQIERGRIQAVKTSDGKTEKAESFVLAGGIQSLDLTRQLDLKLPMQGGKGYSLTLTDPAHNPLLCSLLKEGRVAVTPMGSSLRVAGTMEICGRNTSVGKGRLQGIIESFCRFYPQYSPEQFKGISPWVGLRPCTPDGLPYLGIAPRHDNLVIATGHAMMGLSLAPVTGHLVTQLISKEEPSVNLSSMAPDRFG